jgi:hypothetical protein
MPVIESGTISSGLSTCSGFGFAGSTRRSRQVAQALLAYPEHSVGRMMTLDYVAVRPEWSVREALDYIREHGYDRETLNVVFAVDEEGRLILADALSFSCAKYFRFGLTRFNSTNTEP